MKNNNIKFKIRASCIHDIMGGTIGLTEAQKATLADLESRENGTHPKKLGLTDNMIATLADLRHKQANPELTDGMKSYCIKWLKEYRYKRRKEIKSKYIRKGNKSEQDGITLIVSVLNLGMIRSKTERFYNHYSNGICDIHFEHLDFLVDCKCSWDLETFPLLLDELPKKDARYEDQIQGYMEGYNCENGAVVYTLIDCPTEILGKEIQWEPDPNKKQEIALNLVYTREYWDEVKEMFFAEADDIDFVEIPEKERVKAFYFKRDREHAKDVEFRVAMCQEYIDKLWEELENK